MQRRKMLPRNYSSSFRCNVNLPFVANQNSVKYFLIREESSSNLVDWSSLIDALSQEIKFDSALFCLLRVLVFEFLCFLSFL